MEHWGLVELFRAIDADDDGSISSDELKEFLTTRRHTPLGVRLVSLLEHAHLQKSNLPKRERPSLFATLDANDDKIVTLQEFVVALFDHDQGPVTCHAA